MWNGCINYGRDNRGPHMAYIRLPQFRIGKKMSRFYVLRPLGEAFRTDNRPRGRFNEVNAPCCRRK